MCLDWFSVVRGVGLGMQNCTVLCRTVRRSSAFYFSLFVLNFFRVCVCVFFISRILFSDVPLCICFGALPL